MGTVRGQTSSRDLLSLQYRIQGPLGLSFESLGYDYSAYE